MGLGDAPQRLRPFGRRVVFAPLQPTVSTVGASDFASNTDDSAVVACWLYVVTTGFMAGRRDGRRWGTWGKRAMPEETQRVTGKMSQKRDEPLGGRWFLPLGLSWLLFNLFDLAITFWALETGTAVEANPLMRPLVEVP